jgi:hypothetical protein
MQAAAKLGITTPKANSTTNVSVRASSSNPVSELGSAGSSKQAWGRTLDGRDALWWGSRDLNPDALRHMILSSLAALIASGFHSFALSLEADNGLVLRVRAALMLLATISRC